MSGLESDPLGFLRRSAFPSCLAQTEEQCGPCPHSTLASCVALASVPLSRRDAQEASANARQLAGVMYDQFLALLQAGFTETQALHLLGVMLGTYGAQSGEGGA